MSNDPHNSFMKQRRNLIGISLFLTVLLYLGIEIRELNILGNKVIIDDPSKAPLLLWVAWGYFLVRYYQYFNECEGKEFERKKNDRLYHYSKKLAENRIRREWESKDYTETEWFDEYDYESDKVTVLELEIGLYKNYPTYQTYGPTRIKVQRIKSSGMKDNAEINHHQHHVTISGLSFFYLKLRSFFHAILKTRAATEYYLPFAIALLPIIVTIVATIQNKSVVTTPEAAPPAS